MKGDACHGPVKACLERHPLNSNISKESLQRYHKRILIGDTIGRTKLFEHFVFTEAQ